MKGKDIKVGEVYAIFAKNSDYYASEPTIGRIIAVGVKGRVNGTWHSFDSQTANYVEFEPLTEKYPNGREARTQNYRTDKGHFALHTHVQMLWSEYEPILQKRFENESKRDEERATKREKANTAMGIFSDHGFASKRTSDGVSISAESALEIAQIFKHLGIDGIQDILR